MREGGSLSTDSLSIMHQEAAMKMSRNLKAKNNFELGQIKLYGFPSRKIEVVLGGPDRPKWEVFLRRKAKSSE
jgi:hypothetical protein